MYDYYCWSHDFWSTRGLKRCALHMYTLVCNKDRDNTHFWTKLIVLCCGLMYEQSVRVCQYLSNCSSMDRYIASYCNTRGIACFVQTCFLGQWTTAKCGLTKYISLRKCTCAWAINESCFPCDCILDIPLNTRKNVTDSLKSCHQK